MNSKKRLLEESRFYAIIDREVAGRRPLLDIAAQIKKCSPCLIQLRDKVSKKENILKTAYALRKLLLKTKTIFIINDYIDIAKIADADGVHLGQYDSSLQIARKILGKDKIIGVSAHNLKQAEAGQKQGADYISIGPIFSTPTKPQYKSTGLNIIKEAKKKIKIPFFAIGGINENNAGKIKSYGSQRLCVCRAICRAKDIRKTAENFQKILQK